MNQRNLRDEGIGHRRPQERGSLEHWWNPGGWGGWFPLTGWVFKIVFLAFPTSSLFLPASPSLVPSFWYPALQQFLLPMLCVWQAFRGREIRKGEERHWSRSCKSPLPRWVCSYNRKHPLCAFPCLSRPLVPSAAPSLCNSSPHPCVTSPFTTQDVVS